jgi:transposase-like protein
MIEAESIVHSYNISSINYNLFDFGMEKTNFEEKVQYELFNHEKLLNINDKIHMVNNDHFELKIPLCPNCNSYKSIKQEYKEIKPVLPQIGRKKLYIRRYKCKKCGKKYQTELKGLLNKFSNISHIIKDNIHEYAKNGHESLRKISNQLKIHCNIDISHQTINNILNKDFKDEISVKIPKYSGYYAYDEQFPKTNGKKCRLLLYDTVLDIPIAEKIVKKLSKKVIKAFIEEHTKNQPKIALVTDHHRLYRLLIPDLGFKHQLCVFHLYQMLNNKHRGVLKSKKYSKEYKIQSCIYMTEFREIFRTYDKKECEKRLNKMLDKINDLPNFLKKSLTKKVVKDFDKLTMFLDDGLIAKTSNGCERYFSKTLPKENKNRFRTNKGLLSYLYPQMEKTIETFMKKFHHPKTPNF